MYRKRSETVDRHLRSSSSTGALLRTGLFLGVAVTLGAAMTSDGLQAQVNDRSADRGGTAVSEAAGPTASGDLLDGVRSGEGLSAFLALVEAAELTEMLEGEGPLTIFAPHNSAFAGSDLRSTRLNREDVRNFVLRHVVRGRYDLDDLAQRGHVNRISERQSSTALAVERVGDRITIGGEAWVVGESIETENGVIHVISRVLAG